ncbi:MAG: hypothetical protein V2A34_15220 [Lentisphaerota bacterium]
MPALLIKDFPANIHKWLKQEAVRNRRSMTQQAISILEQGMHRVKPIPLCKPYKGAFPITDEFINKAKQKGRA